MSKEDRIKANQIPRFKGETLRLSERREHENMVHKSIQFMKQDGTDKYFDNCVATDFEKIGLLKSAKRRISEEIDSLYRKRACVEERKSRK